MNLWGRKCSPRPTPLPSSDILLRINLWMWIWGGNHKCKMPLSLCTCMQSRLLYLTLCDPKDCSPPGSSVHGISQVKILEWVAISSSRVSSRPRDQTHVYYVSCIGKHIPYHWRHLRSQYIMSSILIFIKIKGLFISVVYIFQVMVKQGTIVFLLINK